MPIAMKGLRLWPTTNDVVLGGQLIDSSCARITRTNSVGRPQGQALFTLIIWNMR